MDHTIQIDQDVIIPWFFAALGLVMIVLVLAVLTRGGQTALFHLSRVLDAIVIFIGKAGAWLLVPLMLVIVFDVVTRRAEGEAWSSLTWLQDGLVWVKAGVEEGIGATSTKLQELEWHLHAAIFALCFGFAYIANAHVRVDLIREKLKPRSQQWIELIGALLFMIPYCGLLFFIFLEYAGNSYDQGEASSALTGLSHRWIIKAFLPFGFLIAALSAIAVLIRRLLVLFAPPDLVQRVDRFETRTIVPTSRSD